MLLNLFSHKINHSHFSGEVEVDFVFHHLRNQFSLSSDTAGTACCCPKGARATNKAMGRLFHTRQVSSCLGALVPPKKIKKNSCHYHRYCLSPSHRQPQQEGVSNPIEMKHQLQPEEDDKEVSQYPVTANCAGVHGVFSRKDFCSLENEQAGFSSTLKWAPTLIMVDDWLLDSSSIHPQG